MIANPNTSQWGQMIWGQPQWSALSTSPPPPPTTIGGVVYLIINNP